MIGVGWANVLLLSSKPQMGASILDFSLPPSPQPLVPTGGYSSKVCVDDKVRGGNSGYWALEE